MIEATGKTVQVERTRPIDYGSLDQAIYQGVNLYKHPLDAQRREWIFESVRHHLNFTPAYRQLASALHFSIEACEESTRLDAIPVVSSGSFKRRLFDDDRRPAIKHCTSSGTMGTKSVVPRDPRTLERFAGSMLGGAREFLGHDEGQVAYILGPPPEEAGNLWFAYSLSLAEVFHEADYFVRNGEFEPERLYRDLERACRSGTPEPVIGAPPSLVVELCDWMDRTGAASLRLDRTGAWLATAGGWKTAAESTIDMAAFRHRVRSRLGLAAARIRDVFNMVELNTAIFECEAGAKHVPPWLEVMARGAENLSVLPPGESGVLTYLDPTPLSYPGFILSDDVGWVETRGCSCGRVGKTLFLERRLSVIEERGCGRKMERYGKGSSE